MKTRKGFVTNSSSTSFIVAFPKKPESADEIRELLFGNSQRSLSRYDREYTTQELAERIFMDIKEQTVLELSLEFNGNGLCFGSVHLDLHSIIRTDEEHGIHVNLSDLYHATMSQLITNDVEEFVTEHMKNGCFICHFEYADEDGGIFTLLEHGDVFHNVPHIENSHH